MLSPTVYMDTDGQYKGIDQNVHQALQNPSVARAYLNVTMSPSLTLGF